MTISSDTFIQDTILFIKNLLKNNLSDPIVGRTSGFVMTSYPKRQIKYPVVTIKVVNIETQKMGMQSESRWTNLTLEISTFSKNTKESDILTQDIINILRENEYGIKSTDVEEIHGFDVTSVVPITDEQSNQTIHQKVITVEYKVILT